MLYSDLKKMIAVCEMIRTGAKHARLNDFMDLVTRDTTEIMQVKACSIKILDMDRETLHFASSYGLSEDYATRGVLSIEKSGVNRQVIDGALYSIGQIDDTKCFQYPEDVLKEGIHSMLCLPLRVESKTFGVFCVYSDQSNYFTESDIGFFALMTDLIALTMDSIIREKAQNWFLHKAAHQLRSPLGAIDSMLRVLDQGYLGELNPDQKQSIERCLKRLKISQITVADLLKLASDRQEVGPPQLTPVDVGAILSSLDALYRTQAEKSNLAFQVDIAEGLPKLPAQPRMIDDLFSNLISNALKYTTSGGKVTVCLSQPSPDSIVFEVADTGVGIPEADLPRLFTEFFRSENAKAITEEGTGLGLSIVKEILDRLGGTVRVKSQQGCGTHISCSLPVRSQSVPAHTA
jgi:K+-sensing histidine kinase KdpD